MGEFDHWRALQDWVNESDKYQSDVYSIRCAPYNEYMDICLEEQLNYFNNVQDPHFNFNSMQLDLLLPIELVKDTNDVV